MRESVGQAYLYYFIAIFIIIFGLLLVGSISYSKAAKVKNMIIDKIEEENGYNETAQNNVLIYLKDIGYTVVEPICKISEQDSAKMEKNTIDRIDNVVVKNNSYDYCVYKITGKGQVQNKKFVYYKVVSYMRLDIPIIGQFMRFPVSGETHHILENEE
ncbi:MAG: hypothetical protein RR847_02305 [Bacilli bacterium]